jgi:hypothetical protein
MWHRFESALSRRSRKELPVNKPRHKSLSRRRFLATTAAGGAAAVAAPAVLHAAAADAATVLGEGEYRFEANHHWAQLPDKFQWQTTHGVAIDRDGLVYVIHEGHADKPEHPAIFVFDPEGRYVRSFGNQFQGGGHGIEVRDEGSEQFLYVCAYQHLKTFAKLTLKGKVVWQKYAPMKAGVYATGEDTHRQKIWGRDRFLPTNFAFLDDGGFLLSDGYGSYYLHRFDKDGNWVSACGGPGAGQGKFDTPHGIWIDRRPGRQASIVVADRAHHTLQYLSLDGKYIETLEGFGLPANMATWRELLVVPELFGRVTLLDAQNRVVARLGDDAERIKEDKGFKIRSDPAQWKPGRFVHPHDAAFDQDGNLFVTEWVATGRVTKLRRLA